MFKAVVKKFFKITGYDISKTRNDHPPDIRREKEFMEIWKICNKYTRVSIENSFILYKAIQYIVRNKILGDLVECGVWRGGQAMLMAHTLLREGDNMNRNIWLYDTYTGMSEPTNVDIQVGSGLKAKDWWVKTYIKGQRKEYFVAQLEEVRKNMRRTGFPETKLKFIEGKVEDTIPENMPEKISLLRLDTDWYESTYHELNFLYPILSKQGILIVDDYGKWEGSKKATDEYIKTNHLKIFFVRTHKGVIVGVKL